MQKHLLSIPAIQSPLFCYKNLYYVLLAFFLLCLHSQAVHSESFPQEKFKGSYGAHKGRELTQVWQAHSPQSELSSPYSSQPGALFMEAARLSKSKIYNLYQLTKLRKALSPRYIQIFNQKQYVTTAKIIQKGILFTYGSLLLPPTKKVSLAGNFSNWSEIPMQRNQMGIFFHILPVKADTKEASTAYRYKFVVDGVWQHDPNNAYRLVIKWVLIILFFI